MPEAMTVISIMAHPDDAEIFCAGTLALLHQSGCSIKIATITAGGMGSFETGESETIETRKKEARKAAEYIEANYFCLNKPDGFVFDTIESRLDVIKLIRSVKANLVITHLPDDYHSDHRATSSIVEAACLLSTLPNVPIDVHPLTKTPALYYAAPLNLKNHLGKPFYPSCIVDVTEMIFTKRHMIDAHQSQKRLVEKIFEEGNFVEGMLTKHDRALGVKVGVPYAEGFLQHLGAGFPSEPLLQNTLSTYVFSGNKNNQ